MRKLAFACAVAAGVAAASAVAAPAEMERILARARSLELPTAYVPPPGNPLEHHAAGFARIMCSAVFITGLDPDFAAENVGYFIAPYAERARLGKPSIDRKHKTVTVNVPGGAPRVAKFIGDQGCVVYPAGSTQLSFKPETVRRIGPDPATLAWPMGDRTSKASLPTGVDAEKLQRAVDAAFENPAGMTAAVVVTYRGQIIAERYADGIAMHTPLESWSMAKSVSATMMGVLIRRGVYQLNEPAPIPEWQTPGDPRAQIRIADLLHMSSGLRIRAPYDPGYDASLGYPDHLFLYTGPGNAYQYAATRPLEWPPNTVGRYRNTDPVLVNYLIRLGVERSHGDYLAFPQRALFDKIGARSFVIETDVFGNLLGQGADLACARDWARLGNLYLQDGVWNGERLLPPGFVRFVSTLAPAWVADGRPIYGGFFWINGDGAFAIPKESYYMAGAGGQFTFIIPSHDLVVVRLGHFKGDEPGTKALNKALALLMQAVPAKASIQ